MPGYVRVNGACVADFGDMRPADKFDLRGFVAGLHAGRNWQRGSMVYGVEGDIDYAGIKGGADFAYDGGVSGHLSLRSDLQASLRLRLGYAVDRTLFYGTGGIALGQAKLEASSGGVSVSDSNTHIGWTLGAGVERAFSPKWIGRIEARYTDFGSKDYDLGAFGTGIRSGWSQTTLTFGLSYKF